MKDERPTGGKKKLVHTHQQSALQSADPPVNKITKTNY